MKNVKQSKKIEFGDFQTPIELAEIIAKKLINLKVEPDIIIEPTCGTGNFLLAASKNFKSAKKIVGIEINSAYLEEIKNNPVTKEDSRIIIQQQNFFDFSWLNFINSFQGKILLLGNFPWVTNSQQGVIKGNNLPQKNNFQNHRGLDAVTGKSNFDISEWMLIKTVDCLQNYHGYLAMLCKTSVARKILSYIHHHQLNLAYCATYSINTKKYFNANVESCLLFCEFIPNKKQYFCDVFSSMNSSKYQRIGYYHKTLVRDLNIFNKLNCLFSEKKTIKWRSGIKHDCSKIMELTLKNNNLVNGFGEIVDLEDTYIYPLLKSSDIANGKIDYTKKYVLVTQKNIGEPTEKIKQIAPKTWHYLSKYYEYLDNRKSKIYNNKPRFSIFGIGDYSFYKWKIAISGLYKRLHFQLIGEIDNKSTLFDDTVYFISFEDKKEAEDTFQILNNPKIITFYSSLIFWDEKRPIKASILNKLNIEKAYKLLNNYN